MMTIYERIRERRKELGLSAVDVAKALNVSRATIYRYESANIEKLPTSTLEPLAIVLKTTPGFLMGWEENVLPQNCIPVLQVPMIPVVGNISAGLPILAQENIVGYEPAEGINNPEEYFYLRVNGDSMINAGIASGSTVLIRKQGFAENGQIVACLVSGDSATLKRFKQIGDAVVLIPENNDYEPIIVKCTDFDTGYAKILGVAVEVITKKRL